MNPRRPTPADTPCVLEFKLSDLESTAPLNLAHLDDWLGYPRFLREK